MVTANDSTVEGMHAEMVSQDRKISVSPWNTIKNHLQSGDLKVIQEAKINEEENNGNETRESPDRRQRDTPVENFVTEVLDNVQRVNSVRKLRGIIKKGLGCDQENGCIRKLSRRRNKVHFSEENITIEIPRLPVSSAQIAQEICCYYCCFGFLFPSV